MAVGLVKISPREIVGNSIGHPPGRPDAPFDRVSDLSQMPVAVVELTPRVTDADDRSLQIVAGVAHPLGKGATHEAAKPRIAIVRDVTTAANTGPGVCFGHGRACVEVCVRSVVSPINRDANTMAIGQNPIGRQVESVYLRLVLR